MGWPLSAVNDMTERELSLWMVRGPLWPRRLELLLIQMTNLLAQVNGNKTRMSDFDMFNKRLEQELDTAAHEIASFAGAGVRKLGQGRK
ncbi:hypothetical protein [Variovorax sp. PAMC 28711]|uniref:hypothetical protein n=1 Tax=Variovorax sp. PAMC 28711 TaxID=1795631 RepID=UPI00078B7BA7|nr:hypothetical protein [Variovorax sp. PAMC 28711]AMM23163.1 hypothetical protein AX767_01330 [Variovorax sp. PAMC 28711]